MSTDQLIAAAAKAHGTGNLDEAAGLAQAALQREPDNPQAKLLLGVVSAKKGAISEAKPLLESVASSDPSSYFARLWLSIVAKREGRVDDAVRWGREAVDRNPADPIGQNQLGYSYLDSQQFEPAIRAFERAAQSAPKVAVIQTGMAKAFQGMGRSFDAIQALEQAARLDPNSAEIRTDLVEAYGAEMDLPNAIRHAQKLVEIAPDSGMSHVGLARVLVESSQVEEAAEHARLALELSPEDGTALAALGSVFEAMGRIDEAQKQFKRSLELKPRQGFAYFGFTHSHRVNEEDRPIVSQMDSLIADGGLSEKQSMHLRYALGKAHNDLGEYGEAMSHYDEANRLAYRSKFGDTPFDRSEITRSTDFAIRTFNRSFMNRYRTAGSENPLPIVVVGMMRSGTTLTEQILTSHPRIGPAGEQRFWSDHRSDALESAGASMNATLLRQLADEYCAQLAAVAPGKPYVVDKLPSNYSTVGLIHLALPNARIIHIQRHPVDTCLSIYFTPNRSRVDWANNRENIVAAYQQYLRLMEHWRSVVPNDRLLDIRYEELIQDRERVTRQMIEFLGLEWDNACLRPEDNKRSVVTPSVWQVRQPVYTSSMERWRRYEPWLGAFGKLL